MQSSPFEIESDVHGEAARLCVSGELDIASAPRLQHEVEQLIGQVRTLVIDLREISFIDSSGLRLLLVLSDRAQEQGWTLNLVRPPEPALSVFRITGADESLPFIEEPGRG